MVYSFPIEGTHGDMATGIIRELRRIAADIFIVDSFLCSNVSNSTHVDLASRLHLVGVFSHHRFQGFRAPYINSRLNIIAELLLYFVVC